MLEQPLLLASRTVSAARGTAARTSRVSNAAPKEMAKAAVEMGG